MRFSLPLLLLLAAAAPQVRDVARPAAGTAVLAGTVTVDEPNGEPLKRALVTVSSTTDTRQQFVTSTDDRGQFRLSGLPAATVRVMVTKPAYVTTYFGAREPGSTIGLPVSLLQNQTSTIALKAARGAVIAGTVTDENGQPMPGVGIRVQRVTRSVLGERVFTSTSGVLIPTTDDRGAYRMFGLAPGDYVVSAQPRLIGVSEIRPTTVEELRWADRQIAGRGAGGGSPAQAQDSPARAQTITYAPVFFPGTVGVANAGVVTLAAGQERNGVDLKMQFVPTARVEGTVTAADGQPARGAAIQLIGEAETGGGAEAERAAVLLELGLAGTLVTTGADGSFSFQNIEPGAYTVLARTGGVGRAGGASQESSWAMSDIRVDGRDVGGIALRLAPGQRMSGTVAFEGQTTVPATARASLIFRATSNRGLSVSPPPMQPGADSAFTITGFIPASYRVVGTAGTWTLKSAVVGGRDVADVPLEIKPGEDVTGLVLTFTDRAAEVTGILYDGAGRPFSDLSVVLFAADRAMWFSGSRRVRPATRPATDGRFTFTGLVAGEYYLAALTDVSPADLANPAFLEQVVPAAIKVVIAHGEKKTQDLRIAGK